MIEPKMHRRVMRLKQTNEVFLQEHCGKLYKQGDIVKL